MKKNIQQVLINKDERKKFHNLLDILFEACFIDVLTGKFHCKSCGNVVHLDLSKKLVYCLIHGFFL